MGHTCSEVRPILFSSSQANIQAMKARRMRENQIVRRLVNAAGVMLAVAALMFSGIATASSQERPRTLFDLLFGSRQAQPQRQYQQPSPQRARPKAKRSKASSPASRPTPPPAASPAVEFVEKSRTQRKSSSSVTSSAMVWPKASTSLSRRTLTSDRNPNKWLFRLCS